MDKEKMDILQSFVDLAKAHKNSGKYKDIEDDVVATEAALEYIKNIESAKKEMLRCGYYDDDNGKDYVVEVDKNKIQEALKIIYNANEIIIK